jgi:hypothetical protein
MEKYSHGPFEISGYNFTITSHDEEQVIITTAWNKFMSENLWANMENKWHESLHAVYHNYQNLDTDIETYDMLIGYITTDEKVQPNNDISTLHIPAQDYRYHEIKWWTPLDIQSAWQTINTTSHSELPRSHGYDLEMYIENGAKVTIAVSVKE